MPRRPQLALHDDAEGFFLFDPAGFLDEAHNLAHALDTALTDTMAVEKVTTLIATHPSRKYVHDLVEQTIHEFMNELVWYSHPERIAAKLTRINQIIVATRASFHERPALAEGGTR